jgi:hypothetical protein
VLRDAGFARQVEHGVTVRHAWTVETIVGFLHATSFASRAALQEHVDAFDADIRDVLLGVDPRGISAKTSRSEQGSPADNKLNTSVRHI